MTRCLRLGPTVWAAILLTVIAVGPAAAQTAKSAALARELASLLDQGKLDSIAAQASEDAFVAALYFPGAQLLVVSAKYSAPQYIEETLQQKAYQEVYRELQSASIRETKVFITDLGADGLRARPGEGQGFDSYATDATRISFDGDWRRQKISEDEYLKHFSKADDEYAQMLKVLIETARKQASS